MFFTSKGLRAKDNFHQPPIQRFLDWYAESPLIAGYPFFKSKSISKFQEQDQIAALKERTIQGGRGLVRGFAAISRHNCRFEIP